MHSDGRIHNSRVHSSILQLALNLFWVAHHEALDRLDACEFVRSVTGKFAPIHVEGLER